MDSYQCTMFVKHRDCGHMVFNNNKALCRIEVTTSASV